LSENRYGRRAPFRQTKEEVLVVCGGQTEQIYFDLFKQVFRPSLESALHRNRYKDELGKLLVFPYDKSRETVTKTCGAILTEEKVKAAIVNARLGYERHVANTVPSRPSVFESCTTVYKLVRSLLNWVE
jgi:hypothetical protein